MIDRTAAYRFSTRIGEAAAFAAGDGPTVVLVHGYCGGHDDWSGVAERLVPSHRVLLIDLPGHGDAGAVTGMAGIEDVGSVIETALHTLEVRDAVVVGHSLGGIGLLDLARRRPASLAEHARGIVLVSTSATPWRPNEVTTVLLGSHPLARPFLKVPVLGRAALRATAFHGGASIDDVDHIRRTWESTPYRTRWAYAAGLSVPRDLREGLEALTIPTVVVTGAEDRLTPPDRARLIAERIPGARLEIVAAAGHAIPVERPDAIAAAIESLAARPTGARRSRHSLSA